MRVAQRLETHAITYRVTGSGLGVVDLTYQNANDASEQMNDVAMPWTLKFNARPGQFLYVSAQNQKQTGTVICEILLDGVVVKTARSSGAYVIASCSGHL